MHLYLAQRLSLVLPTLVGVSIVVFLLVRLLPGDAVTMLLQDYAYAKDADELRAKLGLDRPIYVQYVDWLGGALRGDLGTSLRSKTPVGEELLNRMPVTAELGVLAMLVALAVAIPVGVLAAVRQDTGADYVARSAAIGMLAIPSFWLGTLVITLPSVWWQWTPPLRYTRLLDDPGKNLGHVAIPAIILGLALSGSLMRLTRAQMLEVMRQDFVRTAAAKGLTERAVIFRHALKNAFIPVLTLLGLQVSILVSGTVVLESIFVLPGMGRYLLEAVQYRDYPIIQGLNLIFATVIVLSNLAVDLLYGWLDPRVKYQ
ncbi:MAG TPA: ABC transporter permease [Chloroflexota bacterium]|nr:ABC transporter permease [Chloroflexota bacterium]